jgi:DNA (cytosine-5)-methyltransferase 1
MSSQNKFTVISTFSGCGGSSLGYQLAGGKVLLAVEMDDNAVETYKLNFPETPVYHGDIHNLTSEKVLEITRLKPGELDILDGSPPCQGFSTAGKREFCDPRNQLYNEYVRLLKGLQPKVFVMENVSGLVKGKMKLIFKDILTELKKAGYNVKVRLMNAKYYNVPQSRQRLIFIGVRNDLGISPSHPKPQTKPIPIKECFDNLQIEKDELNWARNKINNPKAQYWYNKTKPGESASKYHPKGHWFNFIKVSLNKPLPTILRTIMGSGSALCHPLDNRVMTISELKRCASYPDTFKFIGKYEDKWARIGNSVPPNFMKAISTHIYENILIKIKIK